MPYQRPANSLSQGSGRAGFSTGGFMGTPNRPQQSGMYGGSAGLSPASMVPQVYPWMASTPAQGGSPYQSWGGAPGSRAGILSSYNNPMAARPGGNPYVEGVPVNQPAPYAAGPMPYVGGGTPVNQPAPYYGPPMGPAGAPAVGSVVGGGYLGTPVTHPAPYYGNPVAYAPMAPSGPAPGAPNRILGNAGGTRVVGNSLGGYGVL